MASRVGTYLSDENIKRMCVIDQTSPGSKTYALYELANSKQKAQRAQNVSNAMLQMSKLQNIPYKTLVQNYENSIRTIPNESVLVYTPSARIPQSVLDARGRVEPAVESIVRPASTGASSRPLIQGASVVLGTAQPVEGQLGVDVSVNTPSPSGTTRSRVLSDQLGAYQPEKSERAKLNIYTLKRGTGAVDNLYDLRKGELRYILQKLGGEYTGQKKEQLIDTIKDISKRLTPPVEGTPVKDVDEAGTSETPTFEPEYDPTQQY